MSARCVPLHDALEHCGGKARGLGQLSRAGFAVPPGFAIVDGSEHALPEDLFERARALGPKVAVRSSAASEDGQGQSFAGQLETLLDVATEDQRALEQAVQACFRSARSERVRAYAGADAGAGMAVVVQRMVAPVLAGVLFTADPVDGRRSRLVIDAVRGLGDALVGGEVTPEHVVLSRRTGQVLSRDRIEASPLISDTLASRMATEAIAIERSFGHPVDLEWALDEAGALQWLQARPITTLGADPEELDTPPPEEDDVYTRSNIGEMMPGLVSPLSLSVTARGIDLGLQQMQVDLGVLREVSDRFLIVGAFSGQLFLNLSRLAVIGTHVAGATPDRMCQSVCGRVIPELRAGPMASGLSRAWRALRYGWYLMSATGRPKRLSALFAALRFEPLDDPRACWERLDRALPVFNDACDQHTAASALSGALAPALLEISAQGRVPSEADHARVAELMGDASGVESADIAGGAQRLAEAIASVEGAGRFVELPSNEAVAWLRASVPVPLTDYLERHGHRSVRELELREKPWSEDPAPLVAMLQAAVRTRLSSGAPVAPRARPRAHIPLLLRPLVAWARAGVRTREATKSMLVRMGRIFRAGYLHLGARLVSAGLLPDVDAVFFLSHGELGRLARGEGAGLAALALSRRSVQEIQQSTLFAPVFSGRPSPVAAQLAAGDGQVKGRPVSPGVVEGRVCVVRTLSEASAIQPGDILVAPITDVGWTPYFSAIRGLATDLGSAVSHGAVVAREVGLPCVVNTGVGTATFRTGDRVRLDGTRGTVELLERP